MQDPTDRVACVAAPQQKHQPPPPATRRSPQGAASLHGEGGQSRRRTAAPRRTAGCGPRPGPAPAASRPAAAAPHDTFPANNNRQEERRTSCSQQPAPPPCDAAKMSPRISIGPEPVLAAHAPSPPAAGSHCPAREGSTPYWEQSFFQLSRPAGPAAHEVRHPYPKACHGAAHQALGALQGPAPAPRRHLFRGATLASHATETQSHFHFGPLEPHEGGRHLSPCWPHSVAPCLVRESTRNHNLVIPTRKRKATIQTNRMLSHP